MLQFGLHYGIQFIVPILIAYFFYKTNFVKVAFILLAGILLDIDHLLANPIFDAGRCSINFHPLHSYWAMMIYLIMLVYKKTRIWGIAFCVHMIADIVDCLFINR
jgi:uncharacterized membrane protein